MSTNSSYSTDSPTQIARWDKIEAHDAFCKEQDRTRAYQHDDVIRYLVWWNNLETSTALDLQIAECTQELITKRLFLDTQIMALNATLLIMDDTNFCNLLSQKINTIDDEVIKINVWLAKLRNAIKPGVTEEDKIDICHEAKKLV